MAIITVAIEEAENRLRELLSQAEQGSEVVITRDGKPSIKLVPLPREVTPPAQRRFGQHRGPVYMSEDFDEPQKL